VSARVYFDVVGRNRSWKHRLGFRFTISSRSTKYDAPGPPTFQVDSPLLYESLSINVLNLDTKTCLARTCAHFLQHFRVLTLCKLAHSLQSDTFSFKVQALISQFGLPSPFRHPRHKGMACIDASPFANSPKSKSFGVQSSNPYIWLICSYLLVSSFRTPLLTAQLPH